MPKLWQIEFANIAKIGHERITSKRLSSAVKFFANDIDPAYWLSKCSHTTFLPFCSICFCFCSFRFCLKTAKRAFLQTQTNVPMNKPINWWASDGNALMLKLLSPPSHGLLSVHVCLCNPDVFATCSAGCKQCHNYTYSPPPLSPIAQPNICIPSLEGWE